MKNDGGNSKQNEMVIETIVKIFIPIWYQFISVLELITVCIEMHDSFTY